MLSNLKRRRTIRGVILERRLIDRRFRHHWKSYLLQCGLSTVALLLVMLVVDVVLQAAFVAAIASTAFIVFVIPHRNAASPRRVVGGHAVATIVGTALAALYLVPALGALAVDTPLFVDCIAVISVGLSILIMVVTNTEHPPAAATALGLVIGGWTPSAILLVLLGAAILSAVHMLLRSRMTNLI